MEDNYTPANKSVNDHVASLYCRHHVNVVQPFLRIDQVSAFMGTKYFNEAEKLYFDSTRTYASDSKLRPSVK